MKEIKLFGRALKEQSLSVTDVNNIAVTKGYIVHPKCANERVVKFLETLPINHNNTFYKSWADVTSKTRLELAMDQVFHYASTYGTDYESPAYIPNDSPTVIDFTDCKVIAPITKEEIQEKIQSMFDSGIALDSDTIVDCIELINELGLDIDHTTIKNKEVMMYFCKESGTLPTTPVEVVRYLVFLYTGQTLLIKSPEVIQEIKSKQVDITSIVNQFGIEALASVFYRFKPLFLAMKKGNEATVNKLRRLAKQYHRPMPTGFWQNVLNDPKLVAQIDENKLAELTNYKKIALLQTIMVRACNTGILPVVVRNGKLFIGSAKNQAKEFHSLLFSLIYDSLVESLSKKACKVKLPQSINLVFPTSEKTFIGHVPFGSYVDMSEDAIVGINWKGEDGAQDLDLSAINIDGAKIGWNSHYNEGGLVYSGDMTSAMPEATELLYCSSGMPDCIIQTNLYNGNPNSKYTVFLAKVANWSKADGPMIDPNHIIYQTQTEMKSGEQVNGMFINNRFYFMDLGAGSTRVSRNSTHKLDYLRHRKETAECYVPLKATLELAGFEIVTENADIDLSQEDKSLLIDLLR